MASRGKSGAFTLNWERALCMQQPTIHLGRDKLLETSEKQRYLFLCTVDPSESFRDPVTIANEKFVGKAPFKMDQQTS